MIYENNSLGKRIKDVRKSLNLTQSEFAKKLGVTSMTISRYENGFREPNLNMLERISLFFDVDLYFFFQTVTDSLKEWNDYQNKEAHIDSITLGYITEKEGEFKFTNPEIEKLVNIAEQLNAEGKKEAVKRVEELTYIPKYTEPDNENE